MKTNTMPRIAAVTLGLTLLTAACAPAATVIIAANFGGLSGNNLNGTSADTFAAGITNAGGSGTWVANTTTFRDNGVVVVATGDSSASLNLGSYFNDAKGTADGKFQLTMAISQTVGSWIALGFAAENTPNINKNFTNTGAGATTTGLATIIYRAQSGVAAPNANGELDMFGVTNQNAVDGPNDNTGTRTVTVTLDLTADGGYNGSSNFGTVTWSDSSLGTLGSFTYPTSRNFGSILISEVGTSGGTISSLTLTQVPEPAAVLLGGLGLLALLRRRR